MTRSASRGRRFASTKPMPVPPTPTPCSWCLLENSACKEPRRDGPVAPCHAGLHLLAVPLWIRRGASLLTAKVVYLVKGNNCKPPRAAARLGGPHITPVGCVKFLLRCLMYRIVGRAPRSF